MLRAKRSSVLNNIENHLEGGIRDRRYNDEIQSRGLRPSDLEAAMQQAEADGFKVCGNIKPARYRLRKYCHSVSRWLNASRLRQVESWRE